MAEKIVTVSFPAHFEALTGALDGVKAYGKLFRSKRIKSTELTAYSGSFGQDMLNASLPDSISGLLIH